MPQHWIIAPVEATDPERYDAVWHFDLQENVISMGWSKLGDIAALTREQLQQAVTAAYPDKPPTTWTLIANMLWRFTHQIRPGDLVIARRGRKQLAAVGDVTGPAYYAPGKNPAFPDHRRFLPVAWRAEPRDLKYPALVFPMHTLTPATPEKFEALIVGTIIDPPSEASETLSDPNVFVLEKYLEEFIVSNFAVIFRNTLTMYVDDDGNEGQQYATDVGPIDILAVRPSDKAFVVIELKKGRPSDQVVGQVLRYMGWVKKNLCKNGERVDGLVICKEPDAKLSYAIEMVSNVTVQYYEVNFRLKPKAVA